MVKNGPIKSIVLASDNAGKITEFGELFADTDIKCIPQQTLGISSAEETGHSFAENAHIKALHAAQQSGYPAISDDSGLCVDALGGRPGIFSARYAGMSHLTDTERDKANSNKLLEELKNVPEPKRTAHFYCALALVWPTQHNIPKIVHVGKWSGRILKRPCGTQGFGYDPIFWVVEKNCSAGELPPDEKHQISHRARAWARLLPEMQEYIV